LSAHAADFGGVEEAQEFRIACGAARESCVDSWFVPGSCMAASSTDDDVATIARIGAISKILQAAAAITGLRFAAVARVTDTHWTACAVYDEINFGLSAGGELDLESTLCNEIRGHRQPIIFNQASTDPIYIDHSTPKRYGFESYISIPIIRSNGEFFGTLCALDPRPAKLDAPAIRATFELFAQLISSELDREDQLSHVQTHLSNAQEVAKLREEFIAVLGHDVRNPLHSIMFSAEALSYRVTDSKALGLIQSMQRSCQRIASLVENMLDFTRGRLGGGIPAEIEVDHQLANELHHVLAEVQTVNPSFGFNAQIDIKLPVACDARRIAQLLGNLLANAVTHGGKDAPIRILARTDETSLQISVANAGPAIAPDKIAQLFQPFKRGTRHDGLGLGLYICSEIAKAHAGSLEVSSVAGETHFLFRMPRLPANTARAEID
jgi:signal transduction histidine kinase